jgi:hypothetical protein
MLKNGLSILIVDVTLVKVSLTPPQTTGEVLYYVHQAKGRYDTELAAQFRKT